MAAGLHRNHQLADVQWAAARGVPLPHPPGERPGSPKSSPGGQAARKELESPALTQGARMRQWDVTLGSPSVPARPWHPAPCPGSGRRRGETLPGDKRLAQHPGVVAGVAVPKKAARAKPGPHPSPQHRGDMAQSGFWVLWGPRCAEPKQNWLLSWQRRIYFRIRSKELELYLSVPDDVEDMKAGRVVVSSLSEQSSSVWYYEDGLLKNQVRARCVTAAPRSRRGPGCRTPK